MEPSLLREAFRAAVLRRVSRTASGSFAGQSYAAIQRWWAAGRSCASIQTTSSAWSAVEATRIGLVYAAVSLEEAAPGGAGRGRNGITFGP